jgi:hypothetical protein
MTLPRPEVIGVACGVFRQEIEALRAAGKIDWPFTYLGSMLHMRPGQLEQQLQARLAAELPPGHGVVLAYGDCCAHMLDFEASPRVARVAGINCCEIVLGHALYRERRAAGAFFFMPEWARRWREIFEQELGLRGEVAKDFMQEMHTRLIYLDTGLQPVPDQLLAEAAAFAGLPLEVRPVSLEILLANLLAARERLTSHA